MTKPQKGKPEQQEKLSRGRTKKVLLRMGGYILRYWPLFLLAIALTLISNQLSLMGPNFSGEAIDAIAAENGKGAELSIENATTGMAAPFHAGAAKYFAEKGATVNVG